MSFNFQLLLLVVLAAGVLVAWLRGRRGDDGTANAARGRVRNLAWYLALALLTVSVLATLSLPAERNGVTSWLLVTAAAIALLLALRPSLARRILPVALIAAGLAGLALAHGPLVSARPAPVAALPQPAISTFVQCVAAGEKLCTYTPAMPAPAVGDAADVDAYGVTMVGNPGIEADLVLPQAWLFLLLGMWLTWRSADPVLARLRTMSGRLAGLAPRAQLRSLVLIPVAVAVASLAVPSWSGSVRSLIWIVVASAAALVVVLGWPRASGRLAVGGILGLGLAGLVLALSWNDGRSLKIYGAVLLGGRGTADVAMAQALGLLAVGAWLVPQAFPWTRRLLGLPPDPELTLRVQQLTQSRAVVVDTAATDLRRLERDLHDGAQARLVALGMSLRAAERLIPVSPDAAVALVAEARETAAKALTELRELVRGVHPPVLADRGLADAVRALALDSPLRVETQVDLPGRPPAPVETACYFAVAELLTNAAKHSGAREAQITVSHAEGRLRITVTDLGLGGADAARGSGLAGVERRLAAFDGILAVSSPVGGPTIVVLEVPCALSSPKTSFS